jgi:hypothetical protein
MVAGDKYIIICPNLGQTICFKISAFWVLISILGRTWGRLSHDIG